MVRSSSEGCFVSVRATIRGGLAIAHGAQTFHGRGVCVCSAPMGARWVMQGDVDGGALHVEVVRFDGASVMGSGQEDD